MKTRVLVRWYARLIRLYPRAYLSEFGEEMLATFSSLMEECSMKSRLIVSLRELGGVLGGALRERVGQGTVPTPLPRHPALRGAVGFGLGYGLLIVLRYIVGPTSARPYGLLGAGFFREVAGFGLIGVLVVVFLGYLASRRTEGGRIKGVGRAVLLVTGFAGAGALTTLFIRLAGRLVPASEGPTLGILIQTAAQAIAGFLVGAMLGAARWGRRAVAPQALIGSAVFAVAYLLMQAFRGLLMLLPVAWPEVSTAIPLTVAAAFCGALAGGGLGVSLRRREAAASR